MLAYIIRRLGLMVPTLFGILLISFVVIQFAPGGPVEVGWVPLPARAIPGEGGEARERGEAEGRGGLAALR